MPVLCRTGPTSTSPKTSRLQSPSLQSTGLIDPDPFSSFPSTPVMWFPLICPMVFPSFQLYDDTSISSYLDLSSPNLRYPTFDSLTHPDPCKKHRLHDPILNVYRKINLTNNKRTLLD